MKVVDQRVSPQAFSRIQEELLRAEMLDYDPTTCVRWAMARVGLWPKDFTITNLIVDYNLKSVINPFEELCSEDEDQR
jgi:hypothetical protein